VDVIRPHPEVVAFLERTSSTTVSSILDDRFLDELPTLAGGAEARDAIRAYLEKYGMPRRDS